MPLKSDYTNIDISRCSEDLLKHVHPRLRKAFEDFVDSVAKANKCHAVEWRLFYKMIAVSCDVGYSKRWRVSQFAELLKDAGFPKIGEFATAYAHGFYSIITYRGGSIYEGGEFV